MTAAVAALKSLSWKHLITVKCITTLYISEEKKKCDPFPKKVFPGGNRD